MLESAVHVLSSSDLMTIHHSSVELLKDVGIRVDHERMRQLLSECGAQVKDSVAKFPEKLTEEVVSKMRDPGNTFDGYVGTLPLKRSRLAGKARVVPIATGQATVAHDLLTDELRPATQADLRDACRVVDALPGAIMGHPVFLPQDAPEMIRDLYAMKVAAQYFPYSDFVEVYSPQVVPYFLEMGRVIRGSDEALKADPPFASWAFATPPFQFGRHGFDIIFKFKDFGLKKGYGVGGVMPILGASTPLTLAGYLVMQTAEVLACNILNWVLLSRISGYGGGPAVLDMQHASPCQSSSEAMLLDLACMDLQHFYGDPEPIFPYALGSDAKIPDIQAGIDKTYSATLAVLAGSRVLSAGMGTLCQSGVASLAQMVIDYELTQQLAHLTKGFIVDDAHIDMDMIKRIGIGGSFLAEEHTVKHMRETLYFPELFDRRMVGDWQRDHKGMLQHAKDKVMAILAAEEPREYLTQEQIRELEQIARHAEAALGEE
jgi:trimethylamine---corrinoid protein Co-methyltransferase